MVWPSRDAGCNAMAAEQSIGILLDSPLGDRELRGAAIDDPPVIPGPDLVSIDWPGGARRSSAESMHIDPTSQAFTWTQRFYPSAEGIAESMILAQEAGQVVDDGAIAAGCQAASGLLTTPFDLNGNPATLVECPNGAHAVWWTLDGDRISLIAAPDAPNIDSASIVDLARSVRRGG